VPHLRIWTYALIALLACSAGAWAQVTLIDGYIPRFSQKREMNEEFANAVGALRQRVIERDRRGDDVPCSSQILGETDWLINYTNQKDRVERRIGDLRASLETSAAAQAYAGEQSPEDGSWGACYEEWFLKVDRSVDPLKELVANGQRPKYPLKFLEAVDTPEKLRARFQRLVTSRVQVDGIDHRKELNLTVTALGQLLFLPELEPVLDPAFPRAQLAAELIRFMDETWQDPETGYWGAWYEIDGTVVKTEDLSITFHVVRYRGGQVPSLHKIAQTTFEIRERRYPFGWQDRGTQNTHHSYDVVALVRVAWPMMTEFQRARAQAELTIILVRTLRLALNARGEFDATPFDSLGEAYYFGVSLLDEIGFFRPSRNFWARRNLDSEPLRQKILARMAEIPSNDPMLAAARRKLQATD
jgi:hypothetical protein